MCSIFTGFLAGFTRRLMAPRRHSRRGRCGRVAGLGVTQIMPMEFILVASVVCAVWVARLMIVFHPALRGFQEYLASIMITPEVEKRMQRVRFGLTSLLLVVLIGLTSAFTIHRPLAALALPEGRTYDQAHDTGYIDWSGPVHYVYLTHKDGSWLPPEEGGGFCGSGCQEWVTRMSSGGSVSGTFAAPVGYFEVNLAMTHDGSAGHATIRACSASERFDAYFGPGGGLPGFVSMPLAVPAGCTTWSVSASGGYVDLRSADGNYSAPPPPADTSTPSTTPTPNM